MSQRISAWAGDGTRFHPSHTMSLWDMLRFDTGVVMRAASAIRHIETAINVIPENDQYKKTDILPGEIRSNIKKRVQELRAEIVGLEAKIAVGVIDDMLKVMGGRSKMTFKDCAEWFNIISVIVRREFSAMQTFCIDQKFQSYFDFKIEDVNDDFEVRFPAAVYEFDEAGKCLALSRSTACVFHLLRAMEVGIRGVARCLAIPDPIKDAERNWGRVLQKIKDETDSRNKSGNWSSGDKELFGSLHASLDAVRVAWRNTTMHVENKYTLDEAEHIFVAVRGFMKRLASRCDEQGMPLA